MLNWLLHTTETPAGILGWMLLLAVTIINAGYQTQLWRASNQEVQMLQLQLEALRNMEELQEERQEERKNRPVQPPLPGLEIARAS